MEGNITTSGGYRISEREGALSPLGGRGGGGVASPLVRNININNRLCKKKIKNVK